VLVGGLMTAALILLVALTNTLGKSRDGDDTASAASPGAPVAETAASTTADGAPAQIQSVNSYDPNGDDGLENEDQIPSVLDGADGTSWPTACYLDRFLGGKVGVGIVVELSTLSRGTLDVTFGALPWAADVYTADTVPSTLGAWGGAVDKSFSTETTRATFELGPTPHRYVLVLLRELAPDDGCSSEFPFRGRIAELVFTPA
jgi:serine/threonine-protein kinase